FLCSVPFRSVYYPPALHDALPIWLWTGSMVTDMTMTSTSVPTNVVEFRDWLAQRAPVTDEASAIDQIRLLNQHQGMIEATSHEIDRKSTRLNSSHVSISYAVFCLK